MTSRPTLTHLVLHAPNRAAMHFHATQLLDEARQAEVFRWHLVELGIPRQRLEATLAEIVGRKGDTMLNPLEQGMEGLRDVLGDYELVPGAGSPIPSSRSASRSREAGRRR